MSTRQVERATGGPIRGVLLVPLGAAAIIAITGDHGEEFFEEGALFHGTHLNHYQTSVPLLCKFQQSRWKEQIDPSIDTMSHMDILPSILHYLTGRTDFSQCFDGQSIFAKDRWPYHLTVLQNGANTPLEFMIQQGSKQLSARFSNSDEVFASPVVEILELRCEEEELPLESRIQKYFPAAFDSLAGIH